MLPVLTDAANLGKFLFSPVYMGNYLRKEGAPIDFLYLVDVTKVGIYFYFAKLFSCIAVKTPKARLPASLQP